MGKRGRRMEASILWTGDNAGKTIVNEVINQVQNSPTQFEQIQNMIDMANFQMMQTVL